MKQTVEHGEDRGAVARSFPQSSTGRFEVIKVLAPHSVA